MGKVGNTFNKLAVMIQNSGKKQMVKKKRNNFLHVDFADTIAQWIVGFHQRD